LRAMAWSGRRWQTKTSWPPSAEARTMRPAVTMRRIRAVAREELPCWGVLEFMAVLV